MNTADAPTIIYEDNAACVAQMHMGYNKSNLTKHIAPTFFYPHELQKSGEIKILQAKYVKISLIYSQSLCHLPASTGVFVELA